jgi:hypothetical protein
MPKTTLFQKKKVVPKKTTTAVEAHHAALWAKQTNTGPGPTAGTRFVEPDLQVGPTRRRALHVMRCKISEPVSSGAEVTQRQKGKAATAALAQRPSLLLVGCLPAFSRRGAPRCDPATASSSSPREGPLLIAAAWVNGRRAVSVPPAHGH